MLLLVGSPLIKQELEAFFRLLEALGLYARAGNVTPPKSSPNLMLLTIYNNQAGLPAQLPM